MLGEANDSGWLPFAAIPSFVLGPKTATARSRGRGKQIHVRRGNAVIVSAGGWCGNWYIISLMVRPPAYTVLPGKPIEQ